MRIGALWKNKKDDGSISISGSIESEVGINLPAGSKLACRLVKNEKHQEGDKLPLYFLEAWMPAEKTTAAPAADGNEFNDDIPF